MPFKLCSRSFRGPLCGRYTWFGYEGGAEWRKDHAAVEESKTEVGTEGYEDEKRAKQTDLEKGRRESESEEKGKMGGDETKTNVNDVPEGVLDEKNDPSRAV